MNSIREGCGFLGMGLFLFGTWFQAGAAEDFGGWMRRNALTVSTLSAVAYGDHRFLALGPGVAVTSTNGIDWSLELPPDLGSTTRRLRHVGGRFVRILIGTESDAVETSVDGRNWTSESWSDGRLFDVAFGNLRYLAVGAGGRIMDSSDGITWRQRQAPVPVDFNAVEYGGGQFIASAPGRPGTLLNSMDGESWEVIPAVPTPTLSAIAYGNGVFMALGAEGPYRSVNGLDWTPVLGPKVTNQRLVYGPEGFVFAFNNTFSWLSNLVGRLPTNGDPATWVETSTTAFLRDTAYGAGRYVVVGDGGTLLSAGSDLHWSVVHPTSQRQILGMAFANGHYASITTTGEIVVSADGLSWTASRLGEAADAPAGLCAGAGGFLAVDVAGRLFDSIDGAHWTLRSRPANALSGIAYGNGTLVAFGPAKALLTSADGTQWNSHAAEMPTDRNAVVWGNGLFVAVGTGNTVISTNGELWTKRNAGTKQVLRGVAAGAGAFVAVGDAGSVVRSTDGQTWLPQASGVTEDLKSVAYGGGRFVAVGHGGIILVSPDGLVWTREVSGAGSPMTSVAYGTSGFVVGGAEGFFTSVAAGPRLSMQGSNAGLGPRVRLSGITGRQCAVYASTGEALGGWSSVTNFPVAAAEAEVRVSSPTAVQNRIFRAVVLP